MSRNEIHVLPNSKQGGWDVKKSNASRASRHYETKKDAIAFAREKSIKELAELIIHGKDGRIQNSNSYGNDPCPPRDRR